MELKAELKAQGLINWWIIILFSGETVMELEAELKAQGLINWWIIILFSGETVMELEAELKAKDWLINESLFCLVGRLLWSGWLRTEYFP